MRQTIKWVVGKNLVFNSGEAKSRLDCYTKINYYVINILSIIHYCALALSAVWYFICYSSLMWDRMENVMMPKILKTFYLFLVIVALDWKTTFIDFLKVILNWKVNLSFNLSRTYLNRKGSCLLAIFYKTF